MRVLCAADAEIRVEAPGVIRRVLVPTFGAEAFAGAGPLRAVHLLEIAAGETLPARRLANLSVLRFCWAAAGGPVWLLRQDCGAGVDVPAWTAPTAVSGVECWVQSRRSNGTPRHHFETRPGPGDLPLARPGDSGWDAPLLVECLDGAAEPVDALWCQLLRGRGMLGGRLLQAGDGISALSPAALQLTSDCRVLRLSCG